MTTAGFYERKGMNPKALTVVVLLHGAALTALVMAKGEAIQHIFNKPPEVIFVPPEVIPPEVPPKPQPEPQESRYTTTPPIIEMQVPRPLPEPPLPPMPIPQGPVIGTAPDPVPEPTLPPPPPPPPSPRIEPARAKGDLTRYVSNDDYPSIAIRAEEEGTTRFRLAVGPDGRVTGCTVTGSSGSSALDQATCRIMKQRARFSPARDANGNAVADTVANAIRWVLPDG